MVAGEAVVLVPRSVSHPLPWSDCRPLSTAVVTLSRQASGAEVGGSERMPDMRFADPDAVRALGVEHLAPFPSTAGRPIDIGRVVR